MHFTTEERVETARKRNVEVSENDAVENPNDPRVYFNLGNSLIGDGQYQKAKENLEKFMTMSNSDDEKYITVLRLAMIEDQLGNKEKAVEKFQIAIGMQPQYSDAYLQLGFMCYANEDLDNAEYYLLMGMVKKPPYHNIMVFNPRDYDYNPMSTLARVYFKKARPDLALPLLKGCSQIYPNNKHLKNVVKDMEKETKRLEKVVSLIEKLDKIEDVEKLKKELAKIPVDLQSHPAVSNLRNRKIIKTESTGKDITYYCGMTIHEWNPIMAKTKGIGGSEEAVINLSKQWVKQGYNVTVYNNCGTQEIIDEGVTYKPFWEFNHRDKTDILIVWRHPKILDYELNAGKIFIDLHDVIGKGEFNEKRLDKIDKIMVKTQFHKSLFPGVPEEKFAVVPNGIDFELFNQDIKKDQYLLVNTSSPDRSMDVLPELFMRVKEKVPQARLKWAYGWEIFDNSYANDKVMMDWRNDINKKMEDAGIENLGRLSQSECAKLYLEGNILAYPSEFAEIHCISICKAQSMKCTPITTDFGASGESNVFGIKVHSDKNVDSWSRMGKWSYGIEDEKIKQQWVDEVVKQLQNPVDNFNSKEFENWKRDISWEPISKQWVKLLSD
jgi:tetratricopeptide (TPR) repeat protein